MEPRRRTVHEFWRDMTSDERALMARMRPLAGTTIVVTGALAGDLRRETFMTYVEAWGGTLGTEVRPSTDWLLAVDPDRRTVKRREAAKFGIAVVDEYGFVKNVLDNALAIAIRDAARIDPDPPLPDPAWFHSATGEPEVEEYEDEIRPLGDYVAPESVKR